MSVTRRATLATVAQAAGVSTPTVSKVLNGRGDVSDTTRRRVQQALLEYEYVPPSTRRTQPGTRSVEMVFSDFANPYFAAILDGVTSAGLDAEIDVVLGRSLSSGRAWARRLVNGGRQGLIVVADVLTPQQLDAFAAAGLPIVVIDPINPPDVDISSVGATNWAGGLSATQHLIDLGHTRIAFAGGPQTMACAQARLHGYRAALENAGIAVDMSLVSEGGFEYPNGYARGRELLDLDSPPTAVVAACDPIGFGVVEAARIRGISVPTQLSVVGFDDTQVAGWACPPLTTVHQPLHEMGRAALRILQTLAAGSTPDTHHIELATHLVVRDSTAPPA